MADEKVKENGIKGAIRMGTMTELAHMLLAGVGNPNEGKIITTSEYSKNTKKIILPDGMDKKAAAEDLMNQYKNEETKQDFRVGFSHADYKDALVAIQRVQEREFGWVNTVDSFWSPPTEISIVVDIKNGIPVTTKGYLGKVRYAFWGDAEGMIGIDRGGVTYIKINAKKKYSNQINEFFDLVNKELRDNSIYKGKAVEVKYDAQWESLSLELMELKPNPLIVLNEDEEGIVRDFILTSVEKAGKRTFLFFGPYGNGKTETANRVGISGLSKGRSFFYVKDTSSVVQVMEKVRSYEPATVFIEDIDAVMEGDDRTEEINNVLNITDGIQTKGRNIIVVFTTNHEDKLNPAFRRPGRIDMVVKFANPTEETQGRIMEKYLSKLKGYDNLGFDVINSKMPKDVSASIVAEIFKRAVEVTEIRGNTVTTSIVLSAIASLQSQIEFMRGKVYNPDTLQNAIRVVSKFILKDTHGEVEETNKGVKDVLSRIS